MNRHMTRALLALYPRAFRDRYGAELASVTDQLIKGGEITQLRATLSLVHGAALEWWRLLFCSRRAVEAMAAAAIIAVAGSLYITGQAPPLSTAASARSTSPRHGSSLLAGCRLLIQTEPGGQFVVPALVRLQTNRRPSTFTMKVPPSLLHETQSLAGPVVFCLKSPGPLAQIQLQLQGVRKP